MNEDPYVDPATGVLRNLLGISDADELARAESDLTSYRLVELREAYLPGRYDLAHLQAFHRFIFGDVYDWAGELRTVAIAKSDLFCLPQHIQSYAEDVFSRLARADLLHGLSREEFVDVVADFLGDVNSLHPFREGNGRTQRAFFGQLTRDAGYGMNWSLIDAAANVQASQAAHRGDLAPLRAMLDRLVDRSAGDARRPSQAPDPTSGSGRGSAG